MKYIELLREKVNSNFMFNLSMKEFNSLKEKGAFNIVVAHIIDMLLKFSMSLIIIHLLKKSEYGILSYSLNILNIILLFNGLGAIPGILQYCSSAKSKSNKIGYYHFGLKIGIIFNLFLSLLLIFISTNIKLPVIGSNRILLLLSFFPVFFIFYQSISVYLRSNFKYKKYGIITITFSSLLLIFSIIGVLFYGLTGVVMSRYISIILVSVLGSFYIKEIYIDRNHISNKIDKKGFIRFSILAMLTNGTYTLFYIIDIQMLGLLTSNSMVVADYKTATVIPFALAFIPATVTTFTYSYFAKFRNNIKWIKFTYKKMILLLASVNLIVMVILIHFAPVVIKAIFGYKYLSIGSTFKILMIVFFVSGTFKIPTENIISAIRKIEVNLLVNVFSLIINIALDYYLIKKYNGVGAAVASLISVSIAAIIFNIYIINFKDLKKKKKIGKNWQDINIIVL